MTENVPPKGIRYLGNQIKKEFHSIKRQKPECNIDKMLTGPVYFRTGRQAIDAGYDACAKCTRYWKSRR